MADQLVDLGVQKHGVRMKGQQQQAPKRQTERARDRGDQSSESQGLALRAAKSRSAPPAPAGQPHAGGGVQRLIFINYMDTAEQRRDEGQQYVVYLAHRAGALAIGTTEDEDQQQLTPHMHYMRRQGLQWNWRQGCKGMLEEWVAERRRLRLPKKSPRKACSVGARKGGPQQAAGLWCCQAMASATAAVKGGTLGTQFWT